MQFLVRIDVHLPASMPKDERRRLLAAEIERGRELRDAGTIAAIWGVAGGLRNVGIWEAGDRAELTDILAALPLAEWLDADVTELVPLDLHAR